MKNTKMKIALSILFSALLFINSTFSKDGIYNVVDFGAINDGKALNTKAIQEAIDACAQQGGGKVIVPPGVYVSVSLFLISIITF
ncbi:MAG: hypothetical protein NWS46_10585, partial [Cyclobacteriaceae bacterium]|nr:hypothetical protein [Cyclobacteriaceae bacterium]